MKDIIKKITFNKYLRFLILAIFATNCYYVAQAQNHGSDAVISVGVSYPNGLEASLAYEKETSYHNAWEFYGNYYIKYAKDPEAGHITKKSFWDNYNIWSLGVAYKPCVSRGRNHHGNVRIGAFGGSDYHKFVGGGSIGYEHTFNLYNRCAVSFLIKEDVSANTQDLFRTGIALSIKVPLSR